MPEQWDMLTSSQEGILASHSVLPGSDEARQMTATSGQSLLALYENSSLAGSLAKTLLATSTWGSTRCWLTWKEKVTPGKRLLFQLVPSTPRIEEIELGLWPTPKTGQQGMSAKTSGRPVEKSTHLTTQVALAEGMINPATGRLWPTPRANDAEKRGRIANDPRNGLPAAVLWPTPTASMHKGSSPASLTRKNGRDRTNDRLDHKMQATEGSGQLNPEWVEWLMGYPIGWTDLER